MKEEKDFIDDEKKDLLKQLIEMDPIIKKTEERLQRLSSDEETLKLYEFRENSRIELNSLIRSAKEEGREEGRIESKKEVAKNLLLEGMAPLKVAEVTGLPIEGVRKLVTD
jgi:predicted transposase/invertase (TIGR01784 family)